MVSYASYWTLWILSCFGQYEGQVLHLPEQTDGALGGIVVFTPENPPSTWTQASWVFNSIPIITAVPDVPPFINPEYEGRVSFDFNTLALELRNLRLDDSGTYTVSTFGVTFRGETLLQVFVNISDVRLTGPEESLIEGESSVSITSEGSGTITSVQWMKDHSPLSPSDRIIFSSDSRSVSISPVQRSDTGEYQCTYTNPVSSETKTLSLTINYGPEDVSIEGPIVVDLGVLVSLICSANSVPLASFSWTINGSDTDVTTDTFIIDDTDVTDSGDYSCTAWNNVTQRNTSHTHTLAVKALGGDGGLSAGAIAGIVIGVLVAVSGICALIVYLTKNNKIPSIQHKGKASGGEAQTKQEPDSNYETVIDVQKTREGTTQGERSESTVYEDMSFKGSDYENVRHGNRPRAPQPPERK